MTMEPNLFSVTASMFTILFTFQLSNQKQIQSWTSEHKLSHKVVYDFKSAKYVGVSDNLKLGTWEEETTKIEKFRVKVRWALPVCTYDIF